jgi:hypothetical protein
MTNSTLQVLQVLQVLHALLADPTREKYGLELSKNSGIAHGTMYGILARLEDWGWLDNRLDYYADRATPPRRYYRLTSDGTEQARAAVEQADQREVDVCAPQDVADEAGLHPPRLPRPLRPCLKIRGCGA